MRRLFHLFGIILFIPVFWRAFIIPRQDERERRDGIKAVMVAVFLLMVG